MTLAKIALAYEFAGIAHAKQRRKGNGEAYVNHPIRVARKLADLGARAEVIISGALHDSVEDSKLTVAMIEMNFGSEVAFIVDEVTDDISISHLPRTERKRQQAEKYKTAHIDVKLVKLVDQDDNLESLLNTLKSRKRSDALSYAKSMITVARACGEASWPTLNHAELTYETILSELKAEQSEVSAA